MKAIIEKVKAAHNALVADIKHQLHVSSGAAREERYNREWDARFIAADAAYSIERGTSSYSAWFRKMKEVQRARNLADAKALH